MPRMSPKLPAFGGGGVRTDTSYLSGEKAAAGAHHRVGYQRLAEEIAVAVRYNGISHAVMMATPEELEDYAVGFSVSSGIIADTKEILDIAVECRRDTACVDISLVQRAFHGLKRSRRAMAESSGCGLCGVAALDRALSDISVRWARDHLLNLLHQTVQDSDRIYSRAPEYVEERQ